MTVRQPTNNGGIERKRETMPWASWISCAFSWNLSLPPCQLLIGIWNPEAHKMTWGAFFEGPMDMTRKGRSVPYLTPHIHGLASRRTPCLLIWHISKKWGQNLGSIASSVILLHGHQSYSPQFWAASSHYHMERMTSTMFDLFFCRNW